MTLDALNDWLLDKGCKPQHLQHIYRAMLGVVPWPNQANEKLPKKLREHLPELHRLLDGLLTLVQTQEGSEEKDSAKLLLALKDGHTSFCPEKVFAFPLKWGARWVVFFA